MEAAVTERLLPHDRYDHSDDMRASIEFAYRAIRERVARGGCGWRGWPEHLTSTTNTHLEDQQ
jgi:hypothetical protein